MLRVYFLKFTTCLIYGSAQLALLVQKDYFWQQIWIESIISLFNEIRIKKSNEEWQYGKKKVWLEMNDNEI